MANVVSQLRARWQSAYCREELLSESKLNRLPSTFEALVARGLSKIQGKLVEVEHDQALARALVGEHSSRSFERSSPCAIAVIVPTWSDGCVSGLPDR